MALAGLRILWVTADAIRVRSHPIPSAAMQERGVAKTVFFGPVHGSRRAPVAAAFLANKHIGCAVDRQ